MGKITTEIRYSQTLTEDVLDLLQAYDPNQQFLLCDTHTATHCLPTLMQSDQLQHIKVIRTQAGDAHKNVEALTEIWKFFSQNGATRKSILINLGGGMITDLGGFAAATFKRGMDCIHIPTTLLSAVDAAVGGKTGINFNGLKNEIGAFHMPKAVLIHTPFFKSLDAQNRQSGFAEMLKHGLLSDPEYLSSLLQLNLDTPETEAFQLAVKRSIDIKYEITTMDPTEKGIRKALNLGHTLGHAFESLSHEQHRPVLHGYAVAWGLIGELFLATKLCGFPVSTLHQMATYIVKEYGRFELSDSDEARIMEYMRHDKKNEGQEINFTLLSDVGTIRLDQFAQPQQLQDMLNYFRTCMQS